MQNIFLQPVCKSSTLLGRSYPLFLAPPATAVDSLFHPGGMYSMTRLLLVIGVQLPTMETAGKELCAYYAQSDTASKGPPLLGTQRP